MALELFSGALLGLGAAELWRAAMEGRKKATNFKPLLTQLESTVTSIFPHANEISQLNHKLNLPHEVMNELIALLQHRQALVLKCSNISKVNVLKKGQYSKQLLNCDYSLLRYFQTILPLDQFKDNKEILFMVRELHMKLVGDRDGQICNQNESSNPKDDDVQICNQNESSNPKYEDEEEDDEDKEDNEEEEADRFILVQMDGVVRMIQKHPAISLGDPFPTLDEFKGHNTLQTDCFRVIEDYC